MCARFCGQIFSKENLKTQENSRKTPEIEFLTGGATGGNSKGDGTPGARESDNVVKVLLSNNVY